MKTITTSTTRRNFIKTATVFTVGTTGLSSLAQCANASPQASKNGVYVIGPIEGLLLSGWNACFHDEL